MAVYCKGGYSLLQAFMPVYTMTYSLRVLQIALHMNKAIESIRLKKKREGGRRFFTQIEPNGPLPYSTVPEIRLRDARPEGWVTNFNICLGTMPKAQNRTAKGSTLK